MAVRAYYEAYPYPERDPRDEKKRLISGAIGLVEFFCANQPRNQRTGPNSQTSTERDDNHLNGKSHAQGGKGNVSQSRYK